MNRFKFRAWDKQNKEMVYSDKEDAFYVNTKGVLFMYSLPKSGPVKYYKSYDVMQYTGLKDKDGKDAYEGDVLAYFKEKIVIEWNEHGLFLGRCIGDNLVYHNLWFMQDSLEVIGNIHANPELLKG